MKWLSGSHRSRARCLLQRLVRAHCHSLCRRLAGTMPGACAVGHVRVTVVPAPTSLSIRASPPMSRMRCSIDMREPKPWLVARMKP
ncbi:MAG: hypothetical protein ACLP8X_32300 [Streptosporangiaceae bacterium]